MPSRIEYISNILIRYIKNTSSGDGTDDGNLADEVDIESARCDTCLGR